MSSLEVNKNIFQNYERNRSDGGIVWGILCLEKELREWHIGKKVSSNERETLLLWLQSLDQEINGKLLSTPTSCETKSEPIHLTVGGNEYIIAHCFGNRPTVMTGEFHFNWKSLSCPILAEKELHGT